MKIYHLFFLILFLKGVVGPDIAAGQRECQERLKGFCYPKDLPCPDCFTYYGSCEFELQCCARIWWLPECEYSTTPSKTFFAKTTTSPTFYDESETPE